MNSKKFKQLLLTWISMLPTSYNINNQILKEVLNFKDLGMLFDSKPRLDTYIEVAVKKATSMPKYSKKWYKEFNDPSVA